MPWIDAHANALVAVLTLVLVGVTAFYAFFTKKTVEQMELQRAEMERQRDKMQDQLEEMAMQRGAMRDQIEEMMRQRHDSARPVLSLEPIVHDPDPAVNLCIVNTGNGPAMNVEVFVRPHLLYHGQPWRTDSPFEYAAASIGVGQTRDTTYCAGGPPRSVYAVRLEYEDIYGRVFETLHDVWGRESQSYCQNLTCNSRTSVIPSRTHAYPPMELPDYDPFQQHEDNA